MKVLLIGMTATLLVVTISPPIHARDVDASILVSGATIRAVPSFQQMTAAYLTIRNVTDQDVRLVAAETEAAETVEIHKMEMIDGMMKMAPVKDILIPAASTVKLEPGGLHLMVIGLKEKLEVDGIVDIYLTFDNGKRILAESKVVPLHEKGSMEGSSMKGSHGHGSSMKKKN